MHTHFVGFVRAYVWTWGRQRLWNLALIWTCWRNLESTPVVSVSQELVAPMQSSVVAASAGCVRNAVALRDACALTLSSGVPDTLGLLELLMKEKFQRLRLETKSLKLSQSSATLGTCSLQEVAASWLQSHAANVHGATSANCFPFSPTAICPFRSRGKVYSSCVRSVMLHAAETWAMKVDILNRLRRNDRAMICWICNVRAKDEVSSDSLLTKLGILDLDVVICTSRMRQFGHVECSTGWTAEVRKLNVVAQKRSGRPRKSWDEVLENDRKKLGMDSADPQNLSEWRGRLLERLVKKPNPR